MKTPDHALKNLILTGIYEGNQTLPDHALKNLILTGIYEGNQTLQGIREFVRITPFTIDGEEYYYRNESGLTSGINYLKNRGWITIYPKDGNGQPIKKPAPTRPYRYYLNELSYKYLSNPEGRMEYNLIRREGWSTKTSILKKEPLSWPA